MSRGFRKQSFSARESSLATSSNKIGSPTSQVVVDKAISAMEGSEYVRDQLAKLLERINFQQVYSQSDTYRDSVKTKNEIKKNKLELVKVLETLPDEVRAAIEVSKDEIKKLYRGAKGKPPSEKGDWKNGNFVYGFTSDKRIATKFQKTWQANGDKEAKVLGAKDIESFGGILDISRVADLARKYNQAQLAKAVGRPVSSVSERDFFALENKIKSGFTKDELKKVPQAMKSGITGIEGLLEDVGRYQDEKELLVYGIKFKRI